MPSRMSTFDAAISRTIASAASSVKPPKKTARRRKRICSAEVRRSWLQAIAPRIVRWRSGRSRDPLVSRSRRCCNFGSIAAGGKSRVRAAASSMAKGSPSS